MSAKVKLISFISAFVLVLGIMIIGVLSAEQVQVNIGGSVSFNATNVYAKVSGNISGAETGNKTFSTLTYSASETTGDESDWTNLVLEFTETPDPIEITITVENLSTQRTLTVNLENTLQGEGLDIAVTRDSGSYNSGTNVELPVSTGDGSSTTTFTLTLTVANPDQSLTDVSFGYILNMYDESVAPDYEILEGFSFDENGVLVGYTGNETNVVIPSSYSIIGVEDKSLEFASFEELVNFSSSNNINFFNSMLNITVIIDDISYGPYIDFVSLASDGTLMVALQNATQSIVFEYQENISVVGEKYTVTSIGDNAFGHCDNLISITIPKGVTSIGQSVFSYCYSLSSVTIPSSVTTIGAYAFQYCYSLTSITIPEGVTSIGRAAFDGCRSLTSITIPEGVTSIGRAAFNFCDSLTSITIPEGVTSIGERAFSTCYSLTSITILENVTSIGEEAFWGCYALAEVYNYSNVTTNLPPYAKIIYNASQLAGDKPQTRITVVDNMQYYVDGADFIALAPTSSNVTEVILDNRTTEINQHAFSSCSSLTTITISEGVTSIGDAAFSQCYALAEVYNYSGLTITTGSSSNGYLGYYAKVVYNASDLSGGKPATRITVVNNMQYYHYDDDFIALAPVVARGVLTEANLDSRTTEINQHAFSNYSSLTSITIPSSVESIGDYAFNGCSLTSVTIDSSYAYQNAGESQTACGALLRDAYTVYVKANLVEDTSLTASSYLTSNFTRSQSANENGYYVYTRN